MAYRDIIRVRKNKESRRVLSKEQHAVLPEHPAGLMELANAELEHAAGGGRLKGEAELEGISPVYEPH